MQKILRIKLKKTIKYLFFIGLVYFTILTIVLIIFRHYIVKFFTKNVEIQNSHDLNTILLMCGFYQILFFLHGISAGILRGCDYIYTTAGVSIGMFTIVSPALCYVFCYTFKLEVLGVFIAEGIIYFVASVIYFTIYLFLDYEVICKNYAQSIKLKKEENTIYELDTNEDKIL